MPQEESRDVAFELKERAMDEAPVGITISDPRREDNPLVYVNDAFERLTGYSREAVLGRNCRFLQGERTDPSAVAELRSAIEAARPVTVELVNYRSDGEPFWNEVTVAPLRDADSEVTNYVGFQVDVTRRKEAQLALADERERLDRLVDRINGLLADVTELLMHGVDRRETERAIVERIAATDAYAAAWIGEPDLAREVLVTAAAAGFDGSLDEQTLELDGTSAAARAYRDRTVVTTETGEGSRFGSDTSDGALAAVPLVYGDAIYGVLVVRGVTADALDERERVVLEAVGRSMATAVNAVQNRRALAADDVVELEFSIADRAFFPVALADAWDCRLDYRGAAASGDAGLRLFVDAVGGPGPPAESAVDVDDVESAARVGGEDSTLVELRLAPGSVVERIAERGGELRSLTAERGVGELEVVIPAEIGGRVILELLEDRYEDVELLAHRESDQRPSTQSAFGAAHEAALTERQATALRSAFFSGYYDQQRTVSGDELANMMGISRATFHQHLRAAERKVFAALLEGTAPHTY
ncbi:PAS domain-containing protein [Natronomonas salina]|uniref:bacterio-opsin activator domain-containing protein n=1 Tax=Natronomonas salina TaxID=1710540 RepID=UPI0015B5597E|nr:bacterio-opsin activator domain-containing protein [Natronomonas salina]QLD90652.1 PAS domain-containing protein [Natronomonas salina]